MYKLIIIFSIIIISCKAPTTEDRVGQTREKEVSPCRMVPFFQLDNDTISSGEMVAGIVGVITSDVDDSKLAKALKSLEYQIDTVVVHGRSFPVDSLYLANGRTNDTTFRFAFKSAPNLTQSILKKEFSASIKLILPGDTMSESMGCEFTNKLFYYVKGSRN